MELTREAYTLPRQLVADILESLYRGWFSDDGEYNNDEVITATEDLEAAIAQQQEQNT